ncbi:hypothetical protein AB0C15_01375 [Micromonospora sp. NPDC048835]|uniref:hypothetical protein n=1 Tax=Micromonospora sp. NPDC048835 TaxID=3155147 RepID=UPI0033E7A34C
MDEAGSTRHLHDALGTLIDAGLIPRQPLAPLTHLLSGAMNEAALWLATSTDPVDLGDTSAALRHLLDSLRAPTEPRPRRGPARPATIRYPGSTPEPHGAQPPHE